MDVMVAPERQRQGLGEVLFRTWDRNVGASLGLGLSDASYRLFQKLQLARRRAGAVPRQAADAARVPPPALARRRSTGWSRRSRWPIVLHRRRARVRCGRKSAIIQRFDESFTQLWERLAPKFDFAVRRDARVPELEVRRRAARPLLDRRAACATGRTPAMPSIATCTSRAAA